MSVQQVLFWDISSGGKDSPPTAAVATDGEKAVSSFSSAYPEDAAKALDENFTIKVELAKGLKDWTPIDVLTYNLMFVVGDVTEFESFEQAQEAAQEAFGE